MKITGQKGTNVIIIPFRSLARSRESALALPVLKSHFKPTSHVEHYPHPSQWIQWLSHEPAHGIQHAQPWDISGFGASLPCFVDGSNIERLGLSIVTSWVANNSIAGWCYFHGKIPSIKFYKWMISHL